MALEAQVCPQCGADLQFPEGQPQVVCSHCGTTVVRAGAPAAGGPTIVQKEIAAEKLVQTMVAREKHLHGHGQPATARIVSAQTTDILRRALEGESVVMIFQIEVQPDGEPAYNAETQALVGLVAVDKYHAGVVLDVRFDPQDHTQVAVVGRHGAPKSSFEGRLQAQKAKEQARRQAAKSKPPSE